MAGGTAVTGCDDQAEEGTASRDGQGEHPALGAPLQLPGQWGQVGCEYLDARQVVRECAESWQDACERAGSRQVAGERLGEGRHSVPY